MLKTRFTSFILFLLIFTISGACLSSAQTRSRIEEILVKPIEGKGKVPEVLTINLSGLQVGGTVSADNVAAAIQNLWKAGIYSDIRIGQEKMDNGFRIIIWVDLLPLVNNIEIEGYKEFKRDELIAAININKNMSIGERKISQMRNALMEMYRKKGFLAAKIDFQLTPAAVDSLAPDARKVDVGIKIVEGKKIKVREIVISGNNAISDKKIKKLMETKEDRWYRGGEFKDTVYEEDKKKIVGLYHTEGYRDAIIASDSTSFDESGGRMTLYLNIREGMQYKFGKTIVEGNTVFTKEQLLEKVKYKEGEIFNDDLVKLSLYASQAIHGMDGIITMYNDTGYLKTQINDIQTVRGDSVDISIDIAEGNISEVSKVIINGNTKTIEKVIRREISLDPGMPFSRTLLERSKRDILALNYFQDVNFEWELHPDDEDVDLKFKVTEKQTGMASLGAGYSERDKLVGTLSFANQNLMGRGQSINFNWDMGARRRSFQVGYAEPWFMDTPTSLSFDVYNIIRSDYTSAFDEEKRKGASVRLGRKLKWPDDYSRAYITYRLEDVDYSNPSTYYSYYLMTGKTSALSFMFLRDSRDLPQFSTSGSRTAATVEIAGGPFKGDLSYYKYLFNNELYAPIFGRLSMVFRTRLGFLKGYKENTYVPYSERFMPGGTSYDGFVRGYSNRQVSPRLNGEEIGGETMLVNNLELQIPIVAQTVYGIAFYDFGNAWRNLSETNPFDVKRSAGIGARVFVPGIGLVGFDFGYGFDKLEGADKVSGWRTHFQFGQMW